MADAKENARVRTEPVSKEGKTTIADEVVAKMVALATKEIDGIHEMGIWGLADTISGLAQRAVKTGESTQGVNSMWK